MKKLLLILLVGLGMSFSAQSQNHCMKDTLQFCSKDTITKECPKENSKECPMMIKEQKTEVIIENNYRYYNGYDDVYFYPHFVAPLWYTPRPWYGNHFIFTNKKHNHNDHIIKNDNFKRKNNQEINKRHRNSQITDGARKELQSTMYKRPMGNGQVRYKSPMKIQDRPNNTPRMNQQMQRPPMQQNRPQQYHSSSSQRQRRGPSVDLETWMFDDTYLNEENTNIDDLLLDDFSHISPSN